MTLSIQTFILGPLQNNTYLIADEETRQAVLIDPSFGAKTLLPQIEKSNWHLTQIWHTHAHFDHIVGSPGVSTQFTPPLPLGLHPLDMDLWQRKGEAPTFGIEMDPLPQPSIWFSHAQKLSLGKETLEVRHTPGHCPGHVAFYSESAHVLFCGDLIFWHSIGRTDLNGGDYETLITSIENEVLLLPLTTKLFSGHGNETTVEEELQHNPFIN